MSQKGLNITGLVSAEEMLGHPEPNPVPTIPPRKRAPRRAAVAKELDAFQKGYDAGQESADGTGIAALFIGGVSGAAFVGIVWALWHVFH